jgi:ribokinase
MGRILISGLVNVETRTQVDAFPSDEGGVSYSSHGVVTRLAGAGYKTAKMLSGLGSQVTLLSVVGRDPLGTAVRESLTEEGLSAAFVLPRIPRTPQSVVLHDGDGRRQLNVDLKGVEQYRYPLEVFDEASEACSLIALCNAPFNLSLLNRARQLGRTLAAVIDPLTSNGTASLDDFIEVSDIACVCDVSLAGPPERWLREVRDRCEVQIAVVTTRDQSALLWVRSDNFIERLTPIGVAERDGGQEPSQEGCLALFSSFLRNLEQQHDPYEALESALAFAASLKGRDFASHSANQRRPSTAPARTGTKGE